MAKDTRRPSLDAWMPGWAGLRSVSPDALPREIAAGLSIAAVAIPIALAYAALTGVPLQVGLYASIFPMVAYALFGPSRYLIVGPDTATCLLVGSALTSLGMHDPQERAAAAGALALIAGVGFGLAAVARLGFIANLLSRPILVGYLSGVAVTLLVSQLSSFTGVAIRSDGLIRPIIEIVRRSSEIHWLTVALAVGFFVLLQALKAGAPRLPGPAIVVAGAILLSWALDLKGRGVDVIGAIPSGLPLPHLPLVSAKLANLGLSALGVLFVSFASGILAAKSFGEKVGARSDPNLELRGFAVANVVAGLFQGFAVTGAASRTAVNLAAGGRTPVAPIAAAVVLAIVVSVLTAPLTLLPQAALGAVLASAALGLFDLNGFGRLAKIDWTELGFALVAMGGVIWVGVLQGVFLAVAVTFAHLLQLAARPKHVKLGAMPGQPGLYSLDRYPDARPLQHGVAFRFESSLLFINAEYFRECAQEALDTTPDARWFLLDAEAMPFADSSALEVLETFKAALEARGARLIIASAHGRFLQAIQRSGLADSLSPDGVHPNLDAALAAAARQASDAPA
jgi:sulfate permease, SulP family